MSYRKPHPIALLLVDGDKQSWQGGGVPYWSTYVYVPTLSAVPTSIDMIYPLQTAPRASVLATAARLVYRWAEVAA